MSFASEKKELIRFDRNASSGVSNHVSSCMEALGKAAHEKAVINEQLAIQDNLTMIITMTNMREMITIDLIRLLYLLELKSMALGDGRYDGLKVQLEKAKKAIASFDFKIESTADPSAALNQIVIDITVVLHELNEAFPDCLLLETLHCFDMLFVKYQTIMNKNAATITKSRNTIMEEEKARIAEEAKAAEAARIAAEAEAAEAARVAATTTKPRRIGFHGSTTSAKPVVVNTMSNIDDDEKAAVPAKRVSFSSSCSSGSASTQKPLSRKAPSSRYDDDAFDELPQEEPLVQGVRFQSRGCASSSCSTSSSKPCVSQRAIALSNEFSFSVSSRTRIIGALYQINPSLSKEVSAASASNPEFVDAFLNGVEKRNLSKKVKDDLGHLNVPNFYRLLNLLQ